MMPRLTPFHLTTELELKPVPFTVRVKAGSPAVLLVGLKPVVVGTGLFTVKAWALEVPPPGEWLYTVTLAVPAVAMSEAGMAAVSCVGDT